MLFPDPPVVPVQFSRSTQCSRIGSTSLVPICPLPCGPPGFHGHGHGFGPGRGAFLLDLPKALGITREQLHEQLRDDKSIADIAKAHGKSLDDVRAALKADARSRADKAVEDGDLTQAQADELLSHLDDALEHLGDAPPMLGRHRRHDGPSGMRPGAFDPGTRAAPDPDPPAGVVS